MKAFKTEVVVAGMSGRFPECDDVNTFKQKLYNAGKFITVNDRRWPVNYKYKFGEKVIPCATGKYLDVNTVDYQVFKMGRIQAYSSDALNRKMLEPSFEAIMDAGINPYSLDGRNIGVYFSSGINEMDTRMLKNNPQFLILPGVAKAMISNHVSFALNLQGPSVTFQTDPHGSLDAFIHGYNAIAEGIVDAALVGVASQVADPKFSLNLMELNFLSPDGICRAFDQNANGFGRSEGTVVLFLQRAEDAKRNYGTIRLSDSYYDGNPENNPSSILNFKEQVLKTFLQTIYAKNNFTNEVSSLSFMELSAAGIKVHINQVMRRDTLTGFYTGGFQRSETVESNAIAEICAAHRKNPLLVGSVKSNVGHTEASAAFMSLFKALLALDTGLIAANLNLQKVNSEIRAFKEGSLQVVNKSTKLEGNMVGVNSIGLFGSMSHTVFQQNPNESKTTRSDDENLPRLLLICGRTENGLRQKIKEIGALPFSKDFVALTNDVFGTFMPIHLYRGYTILPTSYKPINVVQERGEKNRPLWYVFTGMGSQWNEMGKGLLDIPAFANVIQRCDAVLKPKGVDIYNILTSNDPATFDNVLHAFVGINSVQLGLLGILEALDLKPDGFLGHSAGETCCAYVDGCITLEQAVAISYERGRVSFEIKTVKGMMAAVGMGYTQIRDKLPTEVEVACHNSANSCTLSGPVEKVVQAVEELKKNGIFAKAVNVANIAYHSQYMQCFGPPFLAALKKIIPDPKKRSSKWISTSVPEQYWNTPAGLYGSAEYITNNFLGKVLFEEGCKHIPSNAIVVEVSPHGLLQAILKTSLPPTCTNISLTHKAKQSPNFLLEAIGKLYIAGCEPQVNALYPKITYPVPRNTPSIASLATWQYSYIIEDVSILTLEKEPGLSHELIRIQINEDAEYNFLKHHKINEEIVIPASLFMYLTWWMYSLSKNKKLEVNSITFEDVKVHETVQISLFEPKSVSIMIQAGSGNFEVLLENDDNSNEFTLIMTGQISPIDTEKIEPNKSKTRITRTMDSESIYTILRNTGYELGDDFRLLRTVSQNETDWFGETTWRGNWITFVDSLMKFELLPHLNDNTVLLYPSFIRKLTIDTAQFMHLKIGEAIPCHKDLATGRLYCRGLEMHGCEMKMQPSNSISEECEFQGFRFVPYENPNCQNLQEFLDLCLQISVENIEMMKQETRTKLYVAVTTDKYRKSVEEIVKQESHLKSKIIFVDIKEIISGKIRQKDKCFLLITDKLDDVHHLTSKHVLSLVIMPSTASVSPRIFNLFQELAKQSFLEHTFILMKKNRTDTNETVPTVVEWEDWVSSELGINRPTTEFTYVIKRRIESTDLPTILGETKRDPNIRRLFLLDAKTKSFQDYESLAKNTLIRQLPVTVCKNNQWGSYRRISTKSMDKYKENQELSNCNIRIESVEIEYLSSDIEEQKYHQVNSQNLSYGIEYSGIHKSGRRITGLATVEPVDSVAKMDTHLTWTIPEHWTLEEAITVPFTYSQAYYILSFMRQGVQTPSILLNLEDDSLLTACISLALRRLYKVFVTVSNKSRARENIGRKFPQFNESHILDKEECIYERQLMILTKKQGVDLVVNGFRGMEHTTTSFRSTAYRGIFLKIGLADCSNIHSLGLETFLRSVTFLALPNTISSLLRLSQKDKEMLHHQVSEGIKHGIVVPTERKTTHGDTENELLTTDNTERLIKHIPGNNMNSYDHQLVPIDVNHSYLIIGGDNLLLNEFVTWLINEGANKFIIAGDNPQALNKIDWMRKNKLTVTITSHRKVDTAQTALKLIHEANNMASLAAIFFIAVEAPSLKMRNLDTALSSEDMNTPFVSIFSGGLEQCEFRRSRGSPAILIHGDEPECLSPVLSNIGKLLARTENHNAPTLYKLVSKIRSNENKSHYLEFSNYLFEKLTSQDVVNKCTAGTLRFKEITSLSLRYRDTRGVQPIFLIPALDESSLEPLIQKLIYPVFSAKLSESDYSLRDTAHELFNALQVIQPRGPVTLIGETWNACLTIELSQLVRSSGRKCKVFLLEGNPFQWKEWVNSLGDLTSSDFDDNLIDSIVKTVCETPITLSKSAATSSFQDTAIEYARKLNLKDSVTNGFIKSLNVIRQHLVMASQWQADDRVLENTTLFQNYRTANSQLKLSISSEIIILNEENYDSCIRNATVSRAINENASFSWWDS